MSATGGPALPGAGGVENRVRDAMSAGDLDTVVAIVRRALESPARQIVENAGAEGSVVVGKLLVSKNKAYGYDAQNGKYTDSSIARLVHQMHLHRELVPVHGVFAG